jgi:CHASE1-domain containing sensor protein
MPDLSVVRRNWQPVGHLWPILAAGCLGVAVAVSAWFAVSVWEERLATAKFTDVAGDYARVLQNGLDEHVGELLSIRAFYDSSREVDADEFALFTRQILAGQSGRMRVIWCPHVNRNERAEFERKQAEKGLAGYSITNWTMNARPAPSPERDEYFPVLYSTIATKLSATLGMDLNSEPARSQAIQRARDGNMIATAQNVLLRNPIGGERPGFLVVVPVYREGMPTDSVEARRRNVLGIIVGAFQTGAVLDAILATAMLPRNVDLYL